MGVACVDDQDPDALALVLVAKDESHRTFTFRNVREQSNRLANALTNIGIGRGDVVAIVNPASLETAVAFMAIFRMGAIALPLSSLFGPDALAYRLNGLKLEPIKNEHWTIDLDQRLEQIAAIFETLDGKYAALKEKMNAIPTPPAEEAEAEVAEVTEA